MSNIMTPVLPVQGAERPIEPSRSRVDSGNKFSDHLERKVQEKQDRHDDKLGVRTQQERSERTVPPKEKDTDIPQEQETVSGEELPVSDLLAMLLQELQNMAQDKEIGPGEWQVEMPDGDLLQQLALSAGMDETDISTLMGQFTSDSGETELADFLQTLISHFASFENDQPVTTLETDLPMLETLLEKIGLSTEQIGKIADFSVEQDGVLNLERFQAALAQLDIEIDAPLTPLTPWETEQLQALMTRAGVNLGEQLELLPETLHEKAPLFDLERLQALLDKTITLVKNDQPKINPPAFLADLDKILSQAGFSQKTTGMIPVVQESMGEAYKNLLDLFDQTKLRYEEGMLAEEEKLQTDIQKWLHRVVATSEGKETTSNGFQELNLALGQQNEMLTNQTSQHDQQPLSSATNDPAALTTPTEPTSPAPTPRQFTQFQQQQIFNQLSMAAARGLRSGEHQFMLKLHPAELGEVKVDISLRNEQLSVSFTMENSRVKQTLESSMEEFRQNMEEKGFTLGQLNVSVGQGDEGNEEWQRFEMASWSGEKLTADTLEDLPDSVLYHHAESLTYNDERGLSLFV